MGLTGDDPPRLVLIDWQLTAALPPSVDLAWMLLCCQPFDGSRERLIDYYHDQLVRRLGDRFDDSGWEPQLRLALLGQAVRVMGSMLWMAYESPDVLDRQRVREQIPWLCEQVRAGSAYL
jgi:aminoglycoside phosphotransferase (APT) family kinase protein